MSQPGSTGYSRGIELIWISRAMRNSLAIFSCAARLALSAVVRSRTWRRSIRFMPTMRTPTDAAPPTTQNGLSHFGNTSVRTPSIHTFSAR